MMAFYFLVPVRSKVFFQKIQLQLQTQVFAIGTTTANAAKSFTQQPVIISNKPGKENLVTLAIKHFSKSKIY